MSILLTAGKKAALGKPKSAKKKKRATGAKNVALATPPETSSRTAVWHWLLEGIPTTVMFTRHTGEVWCNGEVLETVNSFSNSNSRDGRTIDFCIIVDEDSLHEAQIRIIKLGTQIVTELFVDHHFMVLEYTGQPFAEAVAPIPMDHALCYQGAGNGSQLPSYDEATGIKKK